MPHAASAVSPPLVVGGMLIGLLLLVLFIGILVRTFRNMKSAVVADPGSHLQREIGDLLEQWQASADPDVVRSLIDGLRLAEFDGEAEQYAEALSEITKRYFGTDGVAWEVWWRRDSSEFFDSLRDDLRRGSPAPGYLPVS